MGQTCEPCRAVGRNTPATTVYTSRFTGEVTQSCASCKGDALGLATIPVNVPYGDSQNAAIGATDRSEENGGPFIAARLIA